MSPIVYAVPVFMATILLEAWIARRRAAARGGSTGYSVAELQSRLGQPKGLSGYLAAGERGGVMALIPAYVARSACGGCPFRDWPKPTLRGYQRI